MSERKPTIFRVFKFLFVLLLLAGVAFAGYQFGFSQGVASSPQIAEAMQQWQGQPGLSPHFAMRGYYGHHFGFFPFGGIFGFLFMIFIFFGIMRLLFRPHWMHARHMYGHGPWHHGYPPPPWWGQQPGQPGQSEQQPPQPPADAPKQ